MKFALPLLALLAVASPLYAYHLPASGNGALAKELQDIVDLVPLNKVILITKEYWFHDKDFQAAVKVMKGEHIKQLLVEIEAKTSFKDLINWVQANGLDIYELINRYHRDLGLTPLVPSVTPMSKKIIGGLNGYLKEVRSVMHEAAIFQLINDKFLHSKVFKELVLRVISQETLDLVEFVMSNPHFVAVEGEMQKVGLDKNTFESTISFFMFASVLVH